MGYPRQEYWNGLPFPPPGDLPDLGIEHVSPSSPALNLPQSYHLSILRGTILSSRTNLMLSFQLGKERLKQKKKIKQIQSPNVMTTLAFK